jgi:hypothetical protein
MNCKVDLQSDPISLKVLAADGIEHELFEKEELITCNIIDDTIVSYEHHGRNVSVRKDVKGKHREYCLCWTCQYFNPDDREKNCDIANNVFENCVEYGITTPVWECPYYKRLQKIQQVCDKCKGVPLL